MSRPWLSVVIAATESNKALHACLGSLDVDERVEVIVVGRRSLLEEFAEWRTSASLQRDEGGVNQIIASDRDGVPRLRALGLANAKASIIAFAEDSCRFERGWADAWRRTFRDPEVVLATGPVEQAAGGSRIDWGVFFCEYAPFLTPIDVGRGDRVAGNNFAARGDWLRSTLSQAPEVHESIVAARAISQGRKSLGVSGASVWHSARYQAGCAFRDRFAFGRDFGRLRAAHEPRVRRVAAGLLGPLIFASQVIRLLATILKKRRHGRDLLASFPIVLALLGAWSLGEWVGWVWGPLRDDLEQWPDHPCQSLARPRGDESVVTPGQRTLPQSKVS